MRVEDNGRKVVNNFRELVESSNQFGEHVAYKYKKDYTAKET